MKALMPLIFAVFWTAGSIHAAVDSTTFASAEQEMRYRTLISELRCLVCQNQNLADSNADLAKDLRRQIHTMIERGDTDQSIIDFMVGRYGDFVLYRPPFKRITLLLWTGPFLFLGVGLVVIAGFIRKRSQPAGPMLSDIDRARVRRLLQEEEEIEQ